MIGYIFAFFVFIVLVYLYCKKDDSKTEDDVTTATKASMNDTKSLDYVKKELKNGWNVIMTGVNKKETEAKTQLGKKFNSLENMINNVKTELQQQIASQENTYKQLESKIFELETHMQQDTESNSSQVVENIVTNENTTNEDIESIEEENIVIDE
nr:hypothetical protein NeseNPV-TR_ORF23 [Neodiprion sertifer nucleopolyhedrovirus]